MEKVCDFCKQPAIYRAMTKAGVPANLCEVHMCKHGVVETAVKIPSALTKVCSKCNTAKPITEFYTYTDKAGKERKRPECRTCYQHQRKVNMSIKVGGLVHVKSKTL